MKISYYPYELASASNHSQIQAQGALLKFEFEDETVGYADCHPLDCHSMDCRPRLAHRDLPVDQQLSKLKNHETTRITERCLHFARLDAMGRYQQKSLFDTLEIPRSNWLILDLQTTQETHIQQALDQGFTTFKIKMGNDLAREFLFLQKLTQWLSPKDFKLRLDFNLKLSETDFLAIIPKLAPYRDKIEYIEDPFPFDPRRWELIQQKYGLHLACDFHSHLAIGHPEAARVLVIKPAIQDEAIFLKSLHGQQKIVITSYLDHPIGQLSAAYVAALCYGKSPEQLLECGLTTHFLYASNDFSKQLTTTDARLNPPPGTGFGFDQLLERLPWKPL